MTTVDPELMPGAHNAVDRCLRVQADEKVTLITDVACLEIGAALARLCEEEGFVTRIPPPRLCTDNAAMIAWAGAERLRLGLTDGLDSPALARWPLDASAEKVRGAGVKA